MVRDLIKEVDLAIEACNEIARVRTELLALRRRLREIANEHEIKTPIRPPSQAAMEAFKNSADFASGRKKPEE